MLLLYTWVYTSLKGQQHDNNCIFTILGSGSDAASLLTTAQRKGDQYILNGSKVITNLSMLTI